MGIAAITPASQLPLAKFRAEIPRIRDEVKATRIDSGNVFRQQEGVTAEDSTLNPLYSLKDRYDDSGIPQGRSYPPKDSGFGAEIVFDGCITVRDDLPEDVRITSFWSFRAAYFPVELKICLPETENINWVCIVPRADWQIAGELRILYKDGNEYIPGDRIVPLHYFGPKPVTYYFRPRECNGVQLILYDAKVAKNNAWWAPIYEIAAGYDERAQ